ncbi:MAG: hypothetical protein MJY56_07915 [Bacteroidales bacterium]|nr:hypothetical protein [Bacteroidales bacterium]
MTRLIAESGATKTDWRLLEGKETTISLQSGGINPAVMGADSISPILWDVKNRLGGAEPDEIFFYGAGVIGPDFKTTLEGFFPGARVECESDLTGASRALFGDEAGIAVILGTGSNSCEWDGSGIARHIGCGGFILGDEGSASHLGKMLLSDYIKDLVPSPLKEKLYDWYTDKYNEALDYPSIVRRVYRSETPSAWVASFAPFVTANLSDPYAKDLARKCFKAFAERNLHAYDKSLPVGVVGTFGLVCQELVRESAKEFGFNVVKFVKSPIEALAAYHSR